MERKLFRKNWLILWGNWGEAELFLVILRAKAKYFLGAEKIFIRDLGRSMQYYQESREHRPPWDLTHMSHHRQLNINSKRWVGIRISNASLLGQSWFIIFSISYCISYFSFFIFLWSMKHHIKDVPWINGTICRPLWFR